MLFDGHVSRKVAADCSRVAQRKLQMLDAASVLKDLKVPPGNCLESRVIGRVNTVFGSMTNGVFASSGTTKPKARGMLRLLITTEKEEATMSKILSPVHPGEVLREEFMAPLGISINALARDLHVPVSRVSKIVNEQRCITPDTAMRAARYFGTSAEFWMNLQTRYDLLMAKGQEKAIRQEVHPLATA